MSRPPRFALFFLFLSGGLGLYGLGSESLWLDEASTARRLGLTFKELFFDTGSASQLPLYFWISKVWCGFAGTSEWALRFPALFFGLLCIPAVFFLGRELFDDRVGAWGAFFLAINPYFIHYCQEARPYTLFTLLALCSWALLLRWMRSDGKSALIGYTLVTAGLLYTHPYGVLALPTHLACLGLNPNRGGASIHGPRLRRVLGAIGLASVAFLPLLYRQAQQFRLKMGGGSVAAWLPDPGWGAPVEALNHFFMNPWLAAAAVTLALVPITARSVKDPIVRRSLLFCLSIWVAFMAIPWLVSVTVSPVYFHRYSLPFLPILLLLLGWGCTQFSGTAKTVVVAVLVTLTAVPLHTYYTRVDKAPWRETFGYLAERLSSGDLVILDPGYVDQLADYYLGAPEGVTQHSAYSVAQTKGTLEGRSRVWVLTETEGIVGFEELLRTGAVPGFHEVPLGPSVRALLQNPRALRFRPVSLALFERGSF